ncbi:hypothetical protein CDD83_637 [Cordyceps sp. RAO-2017]|nr:hypothetical protein CDD83_637 [Cordyceps sp. RAO-2017]
MPAGGVALTCFPPISPPSPRWSGGGCDDTSTPPVKSRGGGLTTDYSVHAPLNLAASIPSSLSSLSARPPARWETTDEAHRLSEMPAATPAAEESAEERTRSRWTSNNRVNRRATISAAEAGRTPYKQSWIRARWRTEAKRQKGQPVCLSPPLPAPQAAALVAPCLSAADEQDSSTCQRSPRYCMSRAATAQLPPSPSKSRPGSDRVEFEPFDTTAGPWRKRQKQTTNLSLRSSPPLATSTRDRAQRRGGVRAEPPELQPRTAPQSQAASPHDDASQNDEPDREKEGG